MNEHNREIEERLRYLRDTVARLGNLAGASRSLAAIEQRNGFSIWSRLTRTTRTLNSFAKTLLDPSAHKSSGLHPDRATLENEVSRAYALLEDAFSREGWGSVTTLLEHHFPENRDRAAVLTKLAQLVRYKDPERAMALGQSAYAIDRSAFRAKWLGFMAFDIGNISEAARLMSTLPPNPKFRPSETRRRGQIEGYSRLLVRLPEIPHRAEPAYDPVPRSLIYVASSCQPFHLTGYTVRTHALLKALRTTEWNATCMTRPGYPWDRSDASENAIEPCVECDGIEYSLTKGADLSRMAPDNYISMAATQIETAALRTRPALIQAASDHMSALPALIAARRVGVPFVYEVRGLWELSAASRKQEWERTQRYLLSNRLEALAACEADAVFCITRQLARELEGMGVSQTRIHVLPNGGDPDIRDSTERDRGLIAALGLDPSVFTLGYAGSILFYEGLDDLLDAISVLIKSGSPVQALIAGDGNHLAALRQKSTSLGLDQFVRFVGKVPPRLAHQYLRSVDAAVLPRKRVEVCEIVSPLKPYEIMALETPLLTSDVAPLVDIAERCRGAIALFQASNFHSLADAIERLIKDTSVRHDMVRHGREFLINDGSWSHVAKTMSAVLDTVTSPNNVGQRSRGPDETDLSDSRSQQNLQVNGGRAALTDATLANEGSENDILRQRLHRRFEELATLTRLIFLREQEIESLKKQVDQQKAAARALTNTFSWRVTAPLRALRDLRASRQGSIKLKGEIKLLQQSELFDAKWYLKRNPDVAKSGMDPAEHYIRYGAAEGRNPGPEFDSRLYRERYPDVAASGMNPLVHYLEYGKNEGRDVEN